MLDAAGIAQAEARGYEADDVIATLAARADVAVDIVTGDRDLFQLVDDARQIRVLYTARGFARLEVVDEAGVTARYDIPGRAYAEFAVLRGDPSDGLPGVRVDKFSEIGPAMDAAERTKGPFLIDFRIDPEANVYPIVPLGKSLNDFWEAPDK